MLNKSFWIQPTIKCLCVLSCSLGLATAVSAQGQRQPVQQPAAGGQPGATAPGPGAPASGTKVQSKQLQQMFQAQSAQNQAQYAARQQAAGQPTQQQPQQAGQPGMRQQLGQGQLGQGQAGQGQAQAGQPIAGQGQPGVQGQGGAGQTNGQNSARVPLSPEQAAAITAAQELAASGGGINPVPPFEQPSPEWQEWLEKVLVKWEAESSKVQKFQCEFQRFQFDPTLSATEHYTFAQGELKYMQPDKGLFKVNTLKYLAGKDDKGQSKYELNRKKEFGEYWICDGQNVHLLDRNEKTCTIYQLPPAMRGVGIQASPLPFVFGVKKDELKSRYWINPLPPPKDRPNEIWLEVYPRRAADASNYLKLQVVLDMRDWMPMGLIVFMPNWRPEAQHRELYQFEKRVVNATNILPQMFQKEFIPAKPPADWKVIEEKYQEPQAQQPADQPRVAQPPQPGAPVVK